MRLALLLLIGACSIDEKHAGADLVCNGQPLPSLAPSTVTITGTVKTITGDPLPTTMIAGYSANVQVATTTADSNGAFHYTHDTGKVPHNDHIRGSLATYLDTDVYPQTPIASDQFFDVRLVSAQELQGFGAGAQIAIDFTKAQVLLAVVDCNNLPLPDATISTVPAGTIAYFASGMPSATPTSTDASGLVFIANLPPGPVTLAGSFAGATLRAHDFTATANAVVTTSLQP